MSPSQRASFGEHVDELRGRLMWVILAVVVGAVVGYFLHDKLILLLQQPLNDKLYYTTPGGAFSFVIKVCSVFGVVFALPMLIYQVFGFFGPLIHITTRRSVIRYVVASFLLAAGGISFAYFVSLPAALHFLVAFGNDSNIQSMITANEYFNFVLTYLAGFAVLFQVPLLITLVDRMKPLPPRSLFGSVRYVILASFVIAALITPTPDPMNQLLMAGPIIVLYLLSACVVAVRSLRRNRKARKRQPQPLPLSRVMSSALQKYIMPVVEPVSPLIAAHIQKPGQKMAAKHATRQRYVDIMVAPSRPRPRPKPVTVNREPASYQPRPIMRPVTPRLISDFMTVTAS